MSKCSCRTCSRSKYRGLLSRDSQALSVPLACGSWMCPECGQTIKERWLNRAKLTFALFRSWTTTHCATLTAVESLARRLRRRKIPGCYIRLVAVDGGYLVFHNWLGSGKKMSSKAVFNLLSKHVASISQAECTGRRITCSLNCPIPKGWKRKPSGWKREAITTKSLHQLNNRFKHLLIPFMIRDKRLFRAEYINPLLDRTFDPELSDITRGNTMSAFSNRVEIPHLAKSCAAPTSSDDRHDVDGALDDAMLGMLVI